MANQNVLLENYYDVQGTNPMSFKFRYVKQSNGDIYIYILEQPAYRANQEQSSQATYRNYSSGNPPFIEFYPYPKNINHAMVVAAEWAKRTAHYIKTNKFYSDEESSQATKQLVPQGSSNAQPVSDTNISDLTDLNFVRRELDQQAEPHIISSEEIFTKLNQKIFGQEHAVKAMSETVARHIARKQPKRPAVIFSVGSSGVGKTKTVEVLAEILSELHSDGEYQYLRLDMSEYQEAHRVSQLIGAPQGYVGHGESSQLLDALRSSSKTIVLFDEIEKAHPAILKVLMNAMDAGRLSSASGTGADHQVDCRQSIFIFTSNLDAKNILSDLRNRQAFGDSHIEDQICRQRLLLVGIPSEIIGRIRQFLVYVPITEQGRAEILLSTIVEIAEEYGLKVKFIDPSLVVELMKNNASAHFGARTDRVKIESLLGDALIDARIKGMQAIKILNAPVHCEQVQV